MGNFIVILILLVLKNRPIWSERRNGTPLPPKFCIQGRNPLENLVSKLLEEMTSSIGSNNCMVFITDKHYRRIVNIKGLENRHSVAFYALGIRDNEDFTSTRIRGTREVFQKSKDAGCNAYVILLANGYQTSRLLQFVERERMLNTRGLFVLLHDSRLFQPEMHYIWNRIINVLFIRRYHRSQHRSGDRPQEESIDLNTLFYPPKLRGNVATKYIDTWHGNKFRFGKDHFGQKTKDLQGRTLKVAVFEHIPAVTKDALEHLKSTPKDQPKALGVELELLRIVADALNFKASFYLPLEVETERWGVAGENGTYTGLLGEAVLGSAAFLLGDLHFTLKHMELMDLSVPYNFECLTFLTPESLTDNSWKLLILPFKLYTWIAVLITLAVGGGAFHLFAMAYKKYTSMLLLGQDQVHSGRFKVLTKGPRNPEKSAVGLYTDDSNRRMMGLYLFEEFQNSFLYTYSMLLMISLPKLPKAWALRVFIGWWWLYSILVVVAYRASMTASLANPGERLTIDTILQVSKSSIPVGGWNGGTKDFFLESQDDVSQNIAGRFELTENEEDAVARVANGSFCYYESTYVLQHARAAKQILDQELQQNASKENAPKTWSIRSLHIMQECVINMPISIGMDKHSPLKPQVDRMVRTIVEVGLVQKWISDVMEWSRIAEIRQETGKPKALVNLHKLHGALVALGIGYFFGFLALASEILHWNYIVLRDPMYDKYHLDTFYKKR